MPHTVQANSSVPAPAPAVDGVVYSEMPGTDKPYFRCKRRKATLSVPACAHMWSEAQVADGLKAERLEVCRLCPIGAAHAGESVTVTSRLFGSMICPRCRRGTTRMINGTRCVSCYNREREFLAGKNAKGTAPVKLAPLFPVNLSYSVDGIPKRYSTNLARDLMEPMVSVLRATRGKIAFAFLGSYQLRQGRLF